MSWLLWLPAAVLALLLLIPLRFQGSWLDGEYKLTLRLLGVIPIPLLPRKKKQSHKKSSFPPRTQLFLWICSKP